MILTLVKKRFTTFMILLSLTFPAPLFAAGGLFSGEKDIRIVQTQWFDIIYPARCEKSAAILYQSADKIFEEVAALYGREPFMRLPVVITPATDQLNAFYTPAPYNRIVMFDTSDSSLSSLSESFTQTFLTVFRHELTHATTYNLKNGFWDSIGKVFGDIADLGYVFLSSGMAEGASVSSESAFGEGRLNNEFSRHSVKQAKLEGKFPSYFDMQGASDIYPYGSFYDFNAAFHQWLQEKYGLEKYADFWYTLINVKRLGVASSFKKAYGIKLKDAWKAFYEDYQVPEIPADPVAGGIVQDFFTPDSDKYSADNTYGARYYSLSASEKGMIWAEATSGSVFYLPKEKYDTPQKASKILTFKNMKSIQTARLSADGNYLAISYLASGKPNVYASVCIYDMKSHQLFETHIKGLKDALVFCDDSSVYLAGQRFESPYNNIEVYELLFKDDAAAGGEGAVEPVSRGRIKALVQKACVKEDLNVFAGSFTDCTQGRFAFIQKNGLEYSICIYSKEGKELARHALPEGTYVQELSYASAEGLAQGAGERLCFNWAKAGSLPRLGILREDGTFEFSQQDISGGIFCPCIVQGELVYIGEFFRENRLFKIPVQGESFFTVQSTAEVEAENASFAVAESFLPSLELDSEIVLDSKKYNPFKSFTRGILIPFSAYESDSFGINTGKTGTNYALPFGVTYTTGAPWSSKGDSIYQISAGWGSYTNSFGLSITGIEGSATDLLSAQYSLKTEVDFNGWKQSGANLQLNSYLPAGRLSYIGIGFQTDNKIGKQNEAMPSTEELFDLMMNSNTPFYAVGLCSPADNTIYYRFADSLYVLYSNIHSAGPGRFENAGFSLGAGLSYLYDASLPSSEKSSVIFQNTLALTASATAYIPHLLPFESLYGFTYNLPLRLDLSLFPSSSNYGYAVSSDESFGIAVADFKTETVLFGMDVQKALPFFTPLFIHDFYITAGYYGTFSAYKASKNGFQPGFLGEYFSALKNGAALYQDSLYLKFALELNPNIGIFASSSNKLSIAGGASYSLHTLEKRLVPVNMILELGASF
ncbi:MAG: hypothetical protein IJ688_10975 [Treponema sp.]|nr:hypothetical protein [Treponema sp.]